MLRHLHNIYARAHLDTIHPNALDWPRAPEMSERDFISKMAFGEVGHDDKAIVYIIKELAQLAEIEKHVTGVMTIILSELQGKTTGQLNIGHELHNALSCFAAEELLHSDMFYRYVRILGGKDFMYAENLYAQRVGLYQGTDSPWVKLSALCCSAYIGESVITVFERRCMALDPAKEHFLTKLLVAHGLDEARHIMVDHFVFEHVIKNLSDEETRRMRQILNSTEELNTELAKRFSEHAKKEFGVDYTDGNIANEIQIKLTGVFRQMVFGGNVIRTVDEALTDEHKILLDSFCMQRNVHPDKKAPPQCGVKSGNGL